MSLEGNQITEIRSDDKVYCTKCRKMMRPTSFYTYKDKTKCELCKSCLTLHVNNWEEETYLWILEKFDVPYMEGEWIKIRDKAYAKDPYKMNGMSVIGKYLSKMKLNNYSSYTWNDTERLRELAENQAENRPNSKTEQELEEMRIRYENGEISESQYVTYQAFKAPDPFTMEGPAGMAPTPQPQTPVFEDVALPDIGKELTEEDKIYLATKWGATYTAVEWITLEKLYKEFIDSFDIQGAARIDTLKMICKTSLKMNTAIDSGDIDSYQKLSKVYDALMKSAKFTEAQRKEEKAGEFDSIGQIVFFAEKYGGKIPRRDLSSDYDMIDEKLSDLKRYNRELLANDSTLTHEIEMFMQRSINIEEQKRDMEEAKKAGMEYHILSDDEMNDFSDFIQEEKDKDKEGAIVNES